MNGYCADCHLPLAKDKAVRVIRLVHEVCASGHDERDAEWAEQDARFLAWIKGGRDDLRGR